MTGRTMITVIRATWRPQVAAVWVAVPPLVLIANALVRALPPLHLIPVHGLVFGILVVATTPRDVRARLVAAGWTAAGILGWAGLAWLGLLLADSPWVPWAEVALNGAVPACLVLAGTAGTITLLQLAAATDPAHPTSAP